MTLPDLIYREIKSEHPHLVLSGLLQPLYHSGYLKPGEYSRSPVVDTREFFEINFTFLWLILIVEGYEK